MSSFRSIRSKSHDFCSGCTILFICVQLLFQSSLWAQPRYEGKLVYHRVWYNVRNRCNLADVNDETIDSTKTTMDGEENQLDINFAVCQDWAAFTGNVKFDVPRVPLIATFDQKGLVVESPADLMFSATLSGSVRIDSVGCSFGHSVITTNYLAALDSTICPDAIKYNGELYQQPTRFDIEPQTAQCFANRPSIMPETAVFVGSEVIQFDAYLPITCNVDLIVWRFFGFGTHFSVYILPVYRFTRADTTMMVGVWQDIPLYSQVGIFSADKEKNIVTFDDHRAEIIEASPESLIVRVPEDLVGDRSNSTTMYDTTPRDVELVVKVILTSGEIIEVRRMTVRFIPPRFLLYDEVTRATPPLVQAVMPDEGPRWRQTFAFLGAETDGTAAVRLLNTSKEVAPLTLMGKVISPPRPPIYPKGELFDKWPDPTSGNMFNLGFGNAGIQFPVDLNGLCLIVVEADDSSSWGPFPAMFQIHLAGNVGLPRKLINGVPEPARAIRLDTYFNHPAPRPETLGNAAPGLGEFAETALFKFANPVSTSRFAIAVLIPPEGSPLGFPFGVAPVRSAPPFFPGMLANFAIDPSVPTATTQGAAFPVSGTVVDFTQVPIPASVDGLGPPPGVAAILGDNDGTGVSLPMMTLTGGTITNLILDMGSGNEIVDGAGVDFRVIALSGSYSVAVSNTPFADTFVPIGVGNGTTDFDLSVSGLSSARYVRVMVGDGNADIDAVQSLHFFVDEMHSTAGPLADVGWATITLRRQKSPVTPLDPMLELIGPDGSSLGENESSFGDDTNPDLSDAALINVPLTQQGFHRYLGRGYDWWPDEQSFGSFFTRLETGGNYDPVEITVSSSNENQTEAQKRGTISQLRQRDSYLFQAAPGTTVNIVVNGTGDAPLPDPLVELYDPEDFFIAANDNYLDRGKNAVMTVALPVTGHGGGALLSPGTYRIVVMGVDKTSGQPVAVQNGMAYLRLVNGGPYELKVFTGTTAVESKSADPSLPKEYALYPNYPNPFNPTTLIRYELPKRTQVVLRITDLLGKEVTTLVDEIQNAGFYSINWNGTDNQGHNVASGIFICTIRAKDFVQSRKLTLIR